MKEKRKRGVGAAEGNHNWPGSGRWWGAVAGWKANGTGAGGLWGTCGGQ